MVNTLFNNQEAKLDIIAKKRSYMYKLIATLFISVSLQANIFDFKTFEASFLQTILDDNDKRITYTGNIYVDGAKNALWDYEAPVKKSLYFSNNRLTIIEPELEQAIIKEITDNINIYSILKHAKHVSKNLYKGMFNNKEYLVEVENSVISEIRYKDDFDNSVSISFENQKIDKNLPLGIFKINIPKEYDTIRE